MEIRSSSMPLDGSAAGPHSWRVAPGLTALKLAGAVILLAVAGFAWLRNDPGQFFVAGVAGLGLAALGVRDLVAPVRVAADQDGVTLVTGFARRVRLPWSHIEAVRVDARSRYGLRMESLEIDAGDSIHQFGTTELGAPVHEVVAALAALRRAP
jgi:hypothetical protein